MDEDRVDGVEVDEDKIEEDEEEEEMIVIINK